ncbi:MAG: hypothetical protein M3496_09185, partial [Pseudomonadota bacterium]|nr:hypothetical protein [Pseudomonadota bacterium]
LIRTRVAEIREMGRATQGVTLIALDGGTVLSGLQRVVERDSDVVNGDGASSDGGHATAIDASDDGAADEPPQA